MPRLARTVFANVPHHITQRGNRRENVFFTDDDRNHYLNWLATYCDRHKVDILAYCLMTNHVHLVLVPATETGLQQVLKPLHMRHAQRINRKRGWKGHLWQDRYFSSPLDESYTWSAIRYVECNPVRAKMVRKAEHYPWSSAAGHCGLREDPLITSNPCWQKQFSAVGDWPSWLETGTKPEALETLRKNTGRSLPCGSAAFVRKLEQLAGHSLDFKPQGRPRKTQEYREKG